MVIKVGNKVFNNQEILTNMEKEIVQNGNNLIELLDKLLLEVEETEEVYNTPSGTLFREKLEDYIKDRKEYINNYYLFFEEIVEEIKNTYAETSSYENKMVGE